LALESVVFSNLRGTPHAHTAVGGVNDQHSGQTRPVGKHERGRQPPHAPDPRGVLFRNGLDDLSVGGAGELKSSWSGESDDLAVRRDRDMLIGHLHPSSITLQTRCHLIHCANRQESCRVLSLLVSIQCLQTCGLAALRTFREASTSSKYHPCMR